MNNFNILIQKIFTSKVYSIILLLIFKITFQLILLQNGLRWLTADDFSRTVISWDWLQSPRIYSGVWLSAHFWINGLFIGLFNDLVLGPIILSSLFSSLTLVYLYLLFRKIFDRNISFVSCLIFIAFPFQVWLSVSAMPEPIFFFFIAAAFYHFILWSGEFRIEGINKKSLLQLMLAIIYLNCSNLFRYEGWFFSLAFVLIIAVIIYRKTKDKIIILKWTGLASLSLLSAFWWLYQNFLDYNDPLFFIKETTRLYKDLNTAGFLQRVVQYPFFILYIAPLTSLLAVWKIILTIRNKSNGLGKRFMFIKLFLLFNLVELIILMFSGIIGSGGTNMISRYIVINSILLFPFAVWQLSELRKYILVSGVIIIVLINVIWSFYFQQAYRDDTFEVANLTKRLIQKDYFKTGDKIYFETTEGYFDIYPIQVISNSPTMIITDTIPTAFPVTLQTKRKSKKKLEEERQKLNIIELRKFLELKNIKLFIARSDLLVDKLNKLSYKSEQVGDYRIFYLADNIAGNKNNGSNERNTKDFTTTILWNSISFDKKIILKDYHIDNSNFGLNPQTVVLNWELADLSVFDSLAGKDDDFGRYKIKLELAATGNDITVYDVITNIFSERNTDEFFDTKEIKSIVVLRPFALLNYSRKFKLSPFESGVYDIRLSLVDVNENRELKIYKGDSLFKFSPELDIDSMQADFKVKQVLHKTISEHHKKNPFLPLGRIIAMFPNANYNEILKNSKELSQIIVRYGLYLPVFQRYQGDQMLNIVFTYF